MSYATLWKSRAKPFANHLRVTIEWIVTENFSHFIKQQTSRWCDVDYPTEYEWVISSYFHEVVTEELTCQICVELRRRHRAREQKKKLGVPL